MLVVSATFVAMPAGASGAAPGQQQGKQFKVDKPTVERPRGVVPRTGQKKQAAVQAAGTNPYCTPCRPPLLFTQGQPVMGGLEGSPGSATLVPVWWQPSGYSYTATYKTVIDKYLGDVASASGQPSNVYSVAQQYYQQPLGAGAPIQHIRYAVHTGSDVSDAHAFPSGGASDCVPDAGFTACVSDVQLQNELNSLGGLTHDDAHLYVVFFPQFVETCEKSGPASSSNPCSTNVYCAYHAGVVYSITNILLYANEPFPDLTHCVDPSNGPQAPNGDQEADTQISLVSHETNEAITDSFSAWIDSAGYEDGDQCVGTYGQPQGVAGAFYNQVIGAGHYYTQDEFSNQDFAKQLGDLTTTTGGGSQVYGCVQQEELPVASFTGPSTLALGATGNFDASASSDVDSSDLTFTWSWGDGSPNGTGVMASHVYCTAGTFTVRLNATDAAAWTGTMSSSVTVTPQPPIINSVSPISGPAGGSTVVTISGCGFGGTTSVKFGSTPASSFTVVSDRALQATSPAHAAGAVDISVTTPGGTSGPTSADVFTFLATCPTGMSGKPVVGNYEGSGRSDVALITSSGVCVMQSSGTSFSTPFWWSGTAFYGSRLTLAGDITGNGKTDLVAVNGDSTWVELSNGAGFGAPTQWASQPFYGSRGTFLADVNGDGKADLVAVNDNSVWVMLSTGSGFAAPVQWSSSLFYGGVATLVADVNGDGKADLIAVNTNSTWVMTSIGTGFSAPAQWSGTAFYGSMQTFVADVNGDGKADLVAQNADAVWVMTSLGSSFAGPIQWSSGAFYGTRGTFPGDVNGDGKADLIAVNDSSVWVEKSTGSGFSGPVQWL